MAETQKITPNPKLKDFWAENTRYKILYGGRNSSKSWEMAINALFIAGRMQARILCTRMYQNRIEESVYTLLKKLIEVQGYADKFTILRNKIIHNNTGSEFIFLGLARNITEIQSMEGISLCWIEEGHSITEEIWDVLEPTIRERGSKIWVTMNPKRKTDFAYKKFIANPPHNSTSRRINYDENPYLPDEVLKRILKMKKENFEKYEHIYEGIAKDDDHETVIKRSWVEAAVDAHKKLDLELEAGQKIMGFDPADGGEDKNATTYRKGRVTMGIDRWAGEENKINDSIKRVYNSAIDNRIPTIVYDAIGIGTSTGATIRDQNELKKTNVKPIAFNAGGKVLQKNKKFQDAVKNKDYFKNLKAQLWGNVAAMLEETWKAQNGKTFDSSKVISIDSGCKDIETLIEQLTTPRKEYDASGRMKVESKKDMEKRDLKSPNIADAFVMSYYTAIKVSTKPNNDLIPL